MRDNLHNDGVIRGLMDVFRKRRRVGQLDGVPAGNVLRAGHPWQLSSYEEDQRTPTVAFAGHWGALSGL
jgi:hypothetical protein